MFMHVDEKTREEEEEEEKQPDEKKIQQFCSPMKKKNEERNRLLKMTRIANRILFYLFTLVWI